MRRVAGLFFGCATKIISLYAWIPQAAATCAGYYCNPYSTRLNGMIEQYQFRSVGEISQAKLKGKHASLTSCRLQLAAWVQWCTI